MDYQKHSQKDLVELVEKLESRVAELHSILDIQRKTESALLASEGRYRELVANNPIDTVFVDFEGKVTGYNLAKEKSGERLPDIGSVMYVDYASKHSISMYDELMDCIRTNTTKEYPELQYKDKYLHIKMSPFSGGAIISSINITNLKITELAELASRKRFKKIVETAVDAILMVNSNAIITEWTHQAEKLSGWKAEEIIGKSVFTIIPDRYRALHVQVFNEVLRGNRTDIFGKRLEATIEHRDGHEVPVEVAVAVTKIGDEVAVFVRDTTERKKLEIELQRAQKLESVGLLAGGIAHDFNNILTAILANVALVKKNINDESLVAMLVDTEKASLQARDLVQQLLAFSKNSAPKNNIVLLDKVIRQATESVFKGAKNICNFDFVEDLWPVKGDDEQYRQVVENLVLNSREAVLDTDGTIMIFGMNKKITSDNTLSLPAGDYVQITFQDEGLGIREENIPKLFDPYFTTKQMGSGLGLAVTYSIIKNYGGVITVDSEYGQGSVFNIYLPRAVV
ncbi:MAG: PAS domain S-box protein [Proteobacteria bacterium]|nr:PAS domain S-box protein [Pseudomonadota bacterium]MBU1711302.1 PAS domain S-box protein [Pseudomonadota bacterium]